MIFSDRKDPVSKLVFELTKLPGIGEKTAIRLAYFVLRQSDEDTHSLIQSLQQAKTLIRSCPSCFTFSDQIPCGICSQTARDRTILCVVEKPADISFVEQTSSFRGLYHVLHGVLSPLEGIGPEELRIQELVDRVSSQGIVEVIVATNPSVEGDTTGLYIARLLKPFPTKVTRIAHGIPVGGQLEYSDRQTISKALENRRELRL